MDGCVPNTVTESTTIVAATVCRATHAPEAERERARRFLISRARVGGQTNDGLGFGMQAKALELRDAATFIPVLCVDMNPVNEAQRYLLRRCGYPCAGRPNILMTHLAADGTAAWNDPYAWGGRTFPVAYAYIIEHWDELQDGDVVDVNFILGETTEPKLSERFTA